MLSSLFRHRTSKDILLLCINLCIGKEVLGEEYHYHQTCFIPQERLTAEKIPGSPNEYFIKSDQKYFKENLRCARQGDAMNQIVVAGLYVEGKVVPQNYQEAVKWYAKAADQGNDVGLNGLAMLYKMGKGVPQNYTKAVELFKRSAEQGSPYAKMHLGEMYRDGKGVPQDNIEAYVWFTVANLRESSKTREILALKMTPEQISKAEQESCKREKISPDSKGCAVFLEEIKKQAQQA